MINNSKQNSSAAESTAHKIEVAPSTSKKSIKLSENYKYKKNNFKLTKYSNQPIKGNSSNTKVPDTKKEINKPTTRSKNKISNESDFSSNLNAVKCESSGLPKTCHKYTLRSQKKLEDAENLRNRELSALGASTSHNVKREDPEPSRLTRSGAVLRRSTRNSKGNLNQKLSLKFLLLCCYNVFFIITLIYCTVLTKL